MCHWRHNDSECTWSALQLTAGGTVLYNWSRSQNVIQAISVSIDCIVVTFHLSAIDLQRVHGDVIPLVTLLVIYPKVQFRFS